MRKYFSKIHHRSTRSRAQAMVEFALVLPLLLIVLIGIFEFSRLLFAWIILENSTRFGIRYATTGTYDTTYCPGGVCTTDPEVDAARIPSIKDETTRMVIGFFLNESVTTADDLYFNVTVCSDARTFTPPTQGEYESTNYASCAPDEDPGAPGSRVYVAADYNFKFMVMPFFGLGPEKIHLASYRLGYVEQFRSARAINTPLPMSIPTSTPSITPIPSATNTPVPTATVPSATPITPTSTRTPTPITPTATRTSTRTATNTRTPSRTPTITLTPSRTPSPTITLTPSRTLSPTITLTPSRTLVPTITLTPSRTPTRTPSRTRTPTRTATLTFTPAPATNTRTNTPIVPTSTRTPTTAPTRTRTPTSPPATPTICLDC